MDNSAQIDLKCKEKVTDSDTESHSDVESSAKNRVFLQQQYSPRENNMIDPLRSKTLNRLEWLYEYYVPYHLSLSLRVTNPSVINVLKE